MAKIFWLWLRAILRWLALIAIIPLLAIALLLSPPGLKISLAILGKTMPGTLHYKQVHGSLLQSFSIGQLSYQYQDKQILVKQLHWQWQPQALLEKTLSIQTVTIDTLQMTVPAAPAPASQPQSARESWQHQVVAFHHQLTSLHPPIYLKIQALKINHLTLIQHPGQPSLLATQLNFSGQLDSHTINIASQTQLILPYMAQVQLTVHGSPEKYHLQLSANNPDMHWTINGQLSPQQIQVDTQKALIFGGEVTMHLAWQWENPLQWDIALQARHMDFSLLLPDWPHPLDITLNTSGYLNGNSPIFTWSAVLSSAQTRVETHGKHEQQWDVYWNINAKQLAELIPFSSGSLISNGELHGAITRPQTTGQLKGTLLRWQHYRVDKIAATWNIDLTETHNSNFVVNAEQVFSNFFEIQKLHLDGQGKWEKHQIHATINGYQTDLDLVLDGGLSTNSWQGALKKMTIIAPRTGEWVLVSPTALYLSPQRTEISAMCLKSVSDSQLCFKGQWLGDRTWQTSLSAKLNLEQLSMLIPEKLTVKVPVDLHISAQGLGKQVQQGQINAVISPGFIRYSTPNSTLRTAIKGGKINSSIDKSGANGNFQLELSDQNNIHAEFTSPRAGLESLLSNDQALHGNLAIDLNNLAPLESTFPEMVNPKGKFSAKFSFAGTVGNPLVSGEAQLEQGQVKIPGLNIELTKISLAMKAIGAKLEYTLNAFSGNKSFKLTGRTDLAQTGFPSEAIFSGDSVLLADTPQYTVYVTPNIHIGLQGRKLDITGTLDIPQGVIRELLFQQETTLPEDEVIYIGAHPMAKTTPWQISTQLTVNFGDKVTVDNPGLKGKLNGTVTIIMEPGQVTLGIGRIDITNGIYTVFGRDLTVTPGSGLIFRRSPLNNPSLSIQAVTRVIVTDALSQQQLGTNEITVGMNIGGTSNSPQVTLFSSAGNLSQADMLSYLLLGTSSANISPTNMNLLLQALNTLPLTKKGAGNVGGITNQIKQSLGFSELGVESANTFGPTGEPLPTSTPTSYFVVGKRLTTRLYFRYKYDPFNAVNLFQLNYQFSKNWSLQIESDGANQNGADFLYTIQAGTPKTAEKMSTELPPPK